MSRARLLAAVLGAAAFSLPPAWAQTKPADGSIARADRTFLEKAAVDGRAEVDLANIAKGKALHEEVREFANRMVADHTRANDELRQLAAARGVLLPAEPDRHHRNLAEKLRKPIGPDFDRAYMKEMVEEHEKDVKAFEREAKNAKDPELRAFAARTLEVLRSHLSAARATRDVVALSKRTGDRETGSKKP